MSSNPQIPTPENPGPRVDPGWLLVPGFFVLALVLWLTSSVPEVPTARTPAFDVALLDSGPRREMFTDPPTVRVAGYDQRCNSCHQLFQSNWDGSRELYQHQHITLSHGINDQCVNCHDSEDRDRLVLRDGSTIGFAQSNTLCSQCHGPVTNDWERGIHGKMLGSWDPTSPESRRLNCTECHDPHSPRYDSITPLPGPNTFRMGEPKDDSGHLEQQRDPLKRWAEPATDGGDH
ncbi:MAG: hypothetical protein ACYTF7_04180 [Planctomycetota bacterium]|jgi:hypothetical protein